MTGCAVGWYALRNDGIWPWDRLQPGPIEPGLAALIGTLAGLLVATLSQLSVIRFNWARRLEQEFVEILGPMSGWEVLLLAAFSAVGEEALFRGAIQPDLGLWLTSILFGLLHVGPKRIFLPWTVMAVAMGFVLGGLFLWTGSLLAPVLCHGLINAIDLYRIALKARRLSPGTRTT